MTGRIRETPVLCSVIAVIRCAIFVYSSRNIYLSVKIKKISQNKDLLRKNISKYFPNIPNISRQ
jgi:hypothetical protein